MRKAVVPVLVMMNLHPLKRKSKDSVNISIHLLFKAFFFILSHILCYSQLLSVVVHIENLKLNHSLSNVVHCQQSFLYSYLVYVQLRYISDEQS
jgi:hypothetical protein